MFEHSIIDAQVRWRRMSERPMENRQHALAARHRSCGNRHSDHGGAQLAAEKA
jgi:hypothetical protein